jgi:hypothetical protein
LVCRVSSLGMLGEGGDIKKEKTWINHRQATEEGRRTGFLLLRYGCQLRASALEHSSIWHNLKCIDIDRAKHLVFVYVVVPLMNYMSTKFKGPQDIFVIFFLVLIWTRNCKCYKDSLCNTAV